MVDPGEQNKPVGHRWWILRPGSKRMGIESTDRAHALALVDENWDAPPDTRHPDGFLMRPNAAYTPSALVPPRWSVFNDHVDLSDATVRVTSPSGDVSVTIDHRSDSRIVFVPDIAALAAGT